jgi:hypothetical protein
MGGFSIKKLFVHHQKSSNNAFDLSNNVFDLTDIAVVLSNIVVVLTYTPSLGHFNSVLENN